MITPKHFTNLLIGDWIADMHYGIEPIEARFTVAAHIQWDEPTRKTTTRTHTGYVDHPFYNYIEEFLPAGASIGNKMLHVIGYQDVDALVCAYCYDGRRSGIVILKAKP